MSEVYLRGEDFWQHRPADHSSWYWRKIIEVRDVLAHGFIGERWLGDHSGIYTISFAYNLLVGERHRFDMWKTIWKSSALPRHAFLLWFVVQGRLLTLDRLHRWSNDTTIGMCILCGSEAETHDHIFFKCVYSQ